MQPFSVLEPKQFPEDPQAIRMYGWNQIGELAEKLRLSKVNCVIEWKA